MRLLFSGVILSLVCCSESYATQQRPNIVFILTDNESASLLGAYGNHDVKTPYADRLAQEGMLFKKVFATNGMCSPTRATLFTGLMPSQTGVHTWIDTKLSAQWPKNWSAIGEFRTLPQTLADAGYSTALIGKYHLGAVAEPQLGFQYWLTAPYGDVRNFDRNVLIENGEQYRVNHVDINDFITTKAVHYIAHQRQAHKPFFLYLAYFGPYGLPPTVDMQPTNQFVKFYINKKMPSFPVEPVSLRLIKFLTLPQKSGESSGYGKWGSDMIVALMRTMNNSTARINYASEITLVDYNLGRVMRALKENGFDHNTLVIFSTDQGISYGQHGLWGQSDQSDPSTLYDVDLQVPLIFRQPGVVPAHHTSGLLVSEYDFFPTILDYVGLGHIKIKNTPGLSYAALLKGHTLPSTWKNRDAVFAEQEESRMIRTYDWKYIKRYPLKNDELYDLKKDPGEYHNLIDDAQYHSIITTLNRQLDAFFEKYSDPKYNLWKGGTVKSNSDIPFVWKRLNKNWKPTTVDYPPFKGP